MSLIDWHSDARRWIPKTKDWGGRIPYCLGRWACVPIHSNEGRCSADHLEREAPLRRMQRRQHFARSVCLARANFALKTLPCKRIFTTSARDLRGLHRPQDLCSRVPTIVALQQHPTFFLLHSPMAQAVTGMRGLA